MTQRDLGLDLQRRSACAHAHRRRAGDRGSEDRRIRDRPRVRRHRALVPADGGADEVRDATLYRERLVDRRRPERFGDAAARRPALARGDQELRGGFDVGGHVSSEGPPRGTDAPPSGAAMPNAREASVGVVSLSYSGIACRAILLVMPTTATTLPIDRDRALLVGRAFVPAVSGAVLVAVRGDDLVDATAVAPTSSMLANLDDPAGALKAARSLPRIAKLDDVLANSDEGTRDAGRPWLLAPCDLQAIKAAGVTFVASMLERVIEEQARGDPAKAESVRGVDRRHHRRQPVERAARLTRGGAPQGRADRAERLVAVPRSRHRAGCRDLHEVAADVGGRNGRCDRHPSEVGVEQSGAGDRARGGLARPNGGRDARQRRQPARLRGPQRAAARQGEGQQRVVRDRPVHPPVRRALTPSTTCAGATSPCASKAPTASCSTARAPSA